MLQVGVRLLVDVTDNAAWYGSGTGAAAASSKGIEWVGASKATGSMRPSSAYSSGVRNRPARAELLSPDCDCLVPGAPVGLDRYLDEVITTWVPPWPSGIMQAPTGCELADQLER
jgi:hypothetical protein